MLGTENIKNIEEAIVVYLSKGGLRSSYLLSKVLSLNMVTKQSFYKSLRNLKRNQIVIEFNKTLSLNVIWINKLNNFVNEINYNYRIFPKGFEYLNLSDGEKLIFEFKTIRALDDFWGQAQSLIVNFSSEHKTILSHDPHYWFYLVRKETEQSLLKEISKENKKFLMNIGNDTILDKKIKEDFFDSKNIRFNFEASFDKRINFYVTAIGDYVLEIYLDKKIAEEIDWVYKNNQNNKEVVGILLGFLDKKSKNKIIIFKNFKKAKMYKRKFEKIFFIN